MCPYQYLNSNPCKPNLKESNCKFGYLIQCLHTLKLCSKTSLRQEFTVEYLCLEFNKFCCHEEQFRKMAVDVIVRKSESVLFFKITRNSNVGKTLMKDCERNNRRVIILIRLLKVFFFYKLQTNLFCSCCIVYSYNY